MINVPKTDLGSIFPLGLGSVKAGRGWSLDETCSLFDMYLAHGGNMLDTARVYSDFSNSEEFIGRWFERSGKRHEIILTGKAGHPDITCEPIDMHRSRMSKSEMTKDLEESLALLKTDYVDILLFHRDDESVPAGEHLEIMEDFVRQGKIRYYGCSNWTLRRIREASEYAEAHGLRGFVMNEAFFNAAADHTGPLYDDTLVKMDAEMRAYHAEHPELLATAYSGMAQGFFIQYLTGGSEAVKQKAYDTPENRRIAEEMKARAEKNGTSILQETVAFFKTLNFNCVPYVTPNTERDLLEMMRVFE